MVNLRKKPFYLNDEQIAWVENTIRDMTLEEKFGQLFVLLKATPGVDEKAIQKTLAQSHQGGLRWQGGNKETVYKQNMTYQKNSKVPLLIAANCDDGGNGCCPEGTFVATAAECGAGEGTDNAVMWPVVRQVHWGATGCSTRWRIFTKIGVIPS